MSNQELLELLQSAEMDLYEADDDLIITKQKITEAIEEIHARMRKSARSAA